LHHQPAAEAFDLASDLTLALAQTLKARGLDAKLLTPPLDLRLNAGLSCPQEALQSLTQLAAQGVPVAATLRLPPLKAGTLAGLRIDGRSSREPLSCWVQLAERYDLSAIAATLRREDAGLPLFISELCAEPSGSPPLDALALARVIASTAYLGATAFTVCARPDDCPSAADALTLLTSEGRLRPGPVTQVLAELTRELAAARPAVVLKQTEHIGLHPRAAIGFRPFLRGSEALLALWNNTGATVQLAIELHCLPLDLHLLEIGVGGIRRHYTGVFRFSEEAQRLGRPVIFVELEPAEMNLLSMQLSNGHAGWLAGVDFKPPIPAPKRDKHRPFFEDRPW